MFTEGDVAKLSNMPKAFQRRAKSKAPAKKKRGKKKGLKSFLKKRGKA